MDGTDVRDLGGRLTRLAAATVIGIAAAVIIAFVLPERDHTPNWITCFPKPSGISISLVIAGAVGLTLVVYAVLCAIAARHSRQAQHALPVGRVRRQALPRAVALRRR